MSKYNLTLKDMYEKSLVSHGEKIAVKFGEERLSYVELNKVANRLAHALIHSEITPGDPVALMMSNCIEFIISDIAIIKAGASKVPLNNMLSEKEVLYMLKDSEAKAIIIGPEFYDMINHIRKDLPCLEVVIGLGKSQVTGIISWNQFLIDTPETTPVVDVKSSDLASIGYTGGTTGLPKGIVQTQQNLTMNLISHLIELDIVEQDRILLMSPLPHAAGKFCQVGLLTGATHIITDNFNSLKALQLIEKERITVTFMVPTMIYRLLDTAEGQKFDLASIKTIAYAAAPILEDRLKQGLEMFGPVFFQFYGQSECPNLIARLRKSDHSIEPNKIHLLRSCGSPTLMAEVKIVDEAGIEVAQGEKGEIIVKSPYVMERYHNMPKKTAETIVNNWLYTGDIGKMDQEGYIYLLDRKNDMIISGGMNVYSTEVENAIQQCPGVGQVAVLGIPHHDWGEQVLALIIPKSDNPALKEDIVQFCKKNLANYKQPKEIEFVSEFPLTTYGKIDKKKMRIPYWEDKNRVIN